ncbi:transcription factor bHLH13-like [Panicum miliaceum]|uniref:Transcription factor bHLH13-like n=1 Tax=Panicum miliaceum TaxID=4540 RepID=A0A3L6SI13_PANMI|nr:transcription factor bHLH13-like [Panicum miliaceum]
MPLPFSITESEVHLSSSSSSLFFSPPQLRLSLPNGLYQPRAPLGPSTAAARRWDAAHHLATMLPHQDRPTASAPAELQACLQELVERGDVWAYRLCTVLSWGNGARGAGAGSPGHTLASGRHAWAAMDPHRASAESAPTRPRTAVVPISAAPTTVRTRNTRCRPSRMFSRSITSRWYKIRRRPKSDQLQPYLLNPSHPWHYNLPSSLPNAFHLQFSGSLTGNFRSCGPIAIQAELHLPPDTSGPRPRHPTPQTEPRCAPNSHGFANSRCSPP